MAFLHYYPHAEFYIAGGSGRAFVDTALQKKELKFRDIDVQVVLNDDVDKTKIDLIYNEIIKDAGLEPLHEFSDSHKEFFLNDGERSVDISFYPSVKETAKIGVFDIDAIKTTYIPGKSIDDHIKDLASDGYALSVQKKRISDLYSAYGGYLQGHLKPNPEPAFWPQYPSATIRTVRTMGKMGLKNIPDNIQYWLKGLSSQSYEFSDANWVKLMFKLLSDTAVVEELKLLAQLGIIRHWSRNLENSINEMSAEQLERVLDLKHTSHDPFLVYQKLAQLVPLREQLELANDIRKIERVRAKDWTQMILNQGDFASCRQAL
jgi:hypothetical protein